MHLSSLSFFEHPNSYTMWLDAADKTGWWVARGARARDGGRMRAKHTQGQSQTHPHALHMAETTQCTAHITHHHPTPLIGLVALQSALQGAFPGCTDLSDDPQRDITRFTPHLSLGQWPNKQLLQEDMEVC